MSQSLYCSLLSMNHTTFCFDGSKAATFCPSFLLNVLRFSYSLCFYIPLPSFRIHWCHIHTSSLSQRANMLDNGRKDVCSESGWTTGRAAVCECVYIHMCVWVESVVIEGASLAHCTQFMTHLKVVTRISIQNQGNCTFDISTEPLNCTAEKYNLMTSFYNRIKVREIVQLVVVAW